MWAQLIKSRIKPGMEEQARRLPQEFSHDSGSSMLGQIMVFQNEKNPSEHYTLVMFESEAKARENERSPEQAKRIERLREVYDGQPEYVDLIPIYDSKG